jgi:hypothetical protein
MHAVTVVGRTIEDPTHALFVCDMRRGGRVVNWFTFLDGREAPTVLCGCVKELQGLTTLRLTSRPMGSSAEIVWPAAEKTATCQQRACSGPAGCSAAVDAVAE